MDFYYYRSLLQLRASVDCNDGPILCTLPEVAFSLFDYTFILQQQRTLIGSHLNSLGSSSLGIHGPLSCSLKQMPFSQDLSSRLRASLLAASLKLIATIEKIINKFFPFLIQLSNRELVLFIFSEHCEIFAKLYHCQVHCP